MYIFKETVFKVSLDANQTQISEIYQDRYKRANSLNNHDFIY